MRKSRYSDSQIMAILKQAEAGTPVPALCREHGMSSALFYKWRSKFGGMDASMIKRLKELEAENARLKKMYADVQLQNEVIKEAMEKNVWSASFLQGLFYDMRRLLKCIRPLASGLLLQPGHDEICT